jgi:hypothetical protein
MSKEISKAERAALSGITGIEESVISRIYHLQLLDIPACKKILIREEYRRYTTNRDIRKRGILQLLSEKYRVSRSLVEQIIYNKNTNKQVCCINCGSGISRYKYKKNRGNCDKCKTL